MRRDFLSELGYLAFVTRLKRISDSMIHDGRRLYRDLGMDIEPNWFAVLKLIEKKGPSTVTKIADDLGFSHPSIVTMVNKMIDAGYLASKRSEDDNRKRILELTRDARKKMPEFQRVWRAGTTTLKRMLPDADALRLLDVIEQRQSESGFRERTLAAFRELEEIRVAGFEERYTRHFADLNYEWIEKSYRVEEHDREQLENPVEHIIKPGGEIFIVFVGGEAAGTVAMIPEDKESLELGKMAVSPEFRGYGLGDVLMDACKEYAVSKGAKRIVLESNRKQVAAIRMYRKHGFKEIPLKHSEFQRADIRMELLLEKQTEQSATG